MKGTSKLNEYVLHIDWDYPWPENWLRDWKRTIHGLLRNFHSQPIFVERIIIKPSPSREGGKHVWVHVTTEEELSDDTINELQWLIGDHHTRVWINMLRIDRGLRKFWNKLFDHHIWKKPLPKRCQRCKLREILAEMKKDHVDS